MRRRLRRLRHSFPWLDALVLAVLIAGGIAATICWPDHLITDVAIPTALAVLFLVSRWG
jgi:hypothetical protein